MITIPETVKYPSLSLTPIKPLPPPPAPPPATKSIGNCASVKNQLEENLPVLFSSGEYNSPSQNQFPPERRKKNRDMAHTGCEN